MIYSVFLLWVLFAILEGKREANFWHHRIHSSDYEVFKSKDRHPLFMLQRGSVLIVSGIASYYITGSIWWAFHIFIMNALLFSFFHNGMMYTERHLMDKAARPRKGKWIYPKQWFDQSTTSTAFFTKLMGPISRTVQAVIGLGGYIIYTVITSF